jgi:hypothetical protein
MTSAPFLTLLALLMSVPVSVLVVRVRWAVVWRRDLVVFRLRLPAGLTVDQVTGWLGVLSATLAVPRFGVLPSPPVVVEVVATARGIDHLLYVPAGLRGAVLASLQASLPGVRIDQPPEGTAVRLLWRAAAEAALTSQRRPLGIERAEVACAALLASLQPLHGQETVTVQWVITGAGVPRPVPSVSLIRRHTDEGGPWWLTELNDDTYTDPETVRAARAKQRFPLLRACLRVGVAAGSRARAWSLLGRVWGTLRTLDAPGVGVVQRALPARVVAGRVRRFAVPLLAWPLTLNTAELAGLLGLPVGGVRLPGLTLGGARQLPPPPGMGSSGAVVGVSNYPGMDHRTLALGRVDRLRHVWVVGPIGAGKSTLLAHLIGEDIARGDGVVVIDARGDLVPDILDRIPEQRADEVIVLDPAHTTQPIGFNPLSIGAGEQGRELAVDHVMHIFHEIYRASWGPRTADVLHAALLTLVSTRAVDGSAFTLCEVPELLTRDAFRHAVTTQALPAALRGFWAWYEGLSEPARAEVIGPVLNKLRAFTLRTPLRLLLGQSQGIDLHEVFTRRRVLLVPLRKGVLGTETTQLVGSLLIASLWQATLERARIPPERRRPVWLYVDEFQDLVRLPVDLADMLAQARGLGLGLTLAHQHLGQLPDTVKTAVLGTARTHVVFQLGRDDAHTLAGWFAPLSVEDLMGLEGFEIALRPCIDGATRSPVTGTTLPLPERTRDGARLARASRERYGMPRRDAERGLTVRAGMAGDTSGVGRERRGAAHD